MFSSGQTEAEKVIIEAFRFLKEIISPGTIIVILTSFDNIVFVHIYSSNHNM